jgi:hypothetical protein
MRTRSSHDFGGCSPTLASQLLRTPSPVIVRWNGIWITRSLNVDAAQSPGVMKALSPAGI